MTDILTTIDYWISQIAGGVWIILTGFMVYILYKLRKDYAESLTSFRMMLGLLVIVWLYPVYAFTTDNLWVGEIGNIATLVFTVILYLRLNEQHKPLQKWIIPQIVWLSVASINLGIIIYLK